MYDGSTYVWCFWVTVHVWNNNGGTILPALGVIIIRDVPNICFVFASVQNSGPNSVFVFGRIVFSERIQIVSMYMCSAASDVYGRLHSVPAALAQTAWLWETNEGERVMGRQHARMTAISEVHKEVVNMRTASAASCSAADAIRIHVLIRPNYLYSAE